MPTTTHLVCAPDDLLAPAVVTEWLVSAGSEVQADVPLVRLAVAGEAQLVLTPMAGVLTEHCVAIGEPLAASDLLAMIEAEEPQFGLALLPPDDGDANLGVAACRQGHGPAPRYQAEPHLADAEALALCAALGLAPEEVISAGGVLRRVDVERFVRGELRALAAIRSLVRGD